MSAEPTAGRATVFALGRQALEAHCRDLGASPRWAGVLRRRLLAGEPPALPARLAAGLRERVAFSSLGVLAREPTADGAEKLLLRLVDGETIEAVRLPGTRHASACLSTQVGCAMACRFCASGLAGLRRNLAAGELLDQVALLNGSGLGEVGASRVRRLVLMGSGEPTQNLGAIAEALGVLAEEGGIGPRHVILSTVGPPSAIARLQALGLKLTLALSFHALERELRGALVPTQAHVEPLQLLEAADAYAAANGRPYQLEVVLLGGLNDGVEQARALGAALRGRRVHVSLIAWNEVPGQPFRRPEPERAEAYLASLRAAGCSAALRRTVGGDRHAACGQLRGARGLPTGPTAPHDLAP